MHQCIGLALLFVNRSRAIGLGDLFDGLESKIPPRSDAEDVVEFSYLVLRIMALFWSTSVTFLTCVVLSSRTDFLAEGESNDIYFNLIGLMTWTGFAWFVQIVKPNTLSDPLPLHSYPMDDPFANSRQEDALQEDP
ncbi:hypothetical protein C8J57DRAFT_1318937 [Mycena rebaudengoi]|nr:hypothetical protein C8J57DRAFT_1318937 [Mycena rebaudengoi]